MTRDDHQFPEVRPDPDPRPPVDRLVRSGLLRAFPLPDLCDVEDEEFRRLLEALAQRRSGSSRAT